MIAAPAPPRRPTMVALLVRSLDPVDALVEGIFSILIVLTFTLAARLAADSTASDRLWAEALGAAIAWGVIDGVMYLLVCQLERGRKFQLHRVLRGTAAEEEGIAALAVEFDEVLAPLADPALRQAIYGALFRRVRDHAPVPAGLARTHLFGALGVVLVAVIAALPVVLPLLLVRSDPTLAMRLATVTACAMLFGMGYRWAQYVGSPPARSGLLLLLLGVGLVAVAVPLGG